MDYKALKWSVHDNPNNPGEPCIGVITLNRPERLNAVDPLMRLDQARHVLARRDQEGDAQAREDRPVEGVDVDDAIGAGRGRGF